MPARLRLVLPILILPAAAAAQVLDAWDLDGDGAVDRAEFEAGLGLEGVFGAWDADADGLLDSSEFADGLYALWDTDGDGALSVGEWDAAVDAWLGEADVDLAASAWDADGDGTIGEAEFAEALDASGLFARAAGEADPADRLGTEELGSALFDAADLDADALLGEGEGSWLDGLGEPELAAGIETAPQVIERGEAFVQLPIPCGEDASCAEVAERFCTVLGYGAPIDFLAAASDLYVVRCEDDI